jgi:NAD(P)H-nitrite reductase large subunit
MSQRTVILGRSIAALTALEKFRAYDKDSPLVLVDEEKGPPYSRTLLSHYLAGEIKEQELYIWRDNLFDDWGVKTILGDGARGLDPKGKRVYLQSGHTLEYDQLLVATGGAPLLPKIPGLGARKVLTFRTMRDAQNLKELLESKAGGSLVVIGAGLVGVQVAIAAHKRGWHVFLVESQSCLSPRYLDVEAGRLLEELLIKQGLEVFCGRGAASLSHNPQGEVEEVFLEDGHSLQTDLVVVTAGVRPQIDFLHKSGVDILAGVVVNEYMQTNFSNIYAAGDCAQGPDLLGGPPQVFPLWSVAEEMGKYAGLNLAGQKEPYPGSYHRHILVAFDQVFASFGRVQVPDDEFIPITYQDSSHLSYRKILFDGRKLIGAVMVGQIQDLGVLSNLIGQEVPPAVEKDLLAQNPLRYGQWLFHQGGVARME